MKKKTFEEGFDAGRKFMLLVMTKDNERKLENMERLMRFWRNEARLLRYDRITDINTDKSFEIIDLGEVNYEIRSRNVC